MDAFGTEHMSLIRPLPADAAELCRAIDRWLTVAWPTLQAWTSGYLSRFDLPAADCDDAFSVALMELHRKLRTGVFEAESRVSDRSLFAVVWRRHLVDWGRKWSREQRGRKEAGTTEDGQIDVLAFHEGVDRADQPETPEETVARRLEEPTPAEIDAELGRWRDWPVTTIPLVTIACEACPDDVFRPDAERACAASRVELRDGVPRILGWSRPVEETWTLLQPWLQRYSAWREAGSLTPTSEQVLQLAFILRGPQGSVTVEQWPEVERDKALEWLYQQRSRTLRRLKKRLGPRRGGRGV